MVYSLNVELVTCVTVFKEQPQNPDAFAGRLRTSSLLFSFEDSRMTAIREWHDLYIIIYFRSRVDDHGKKTKTFRDLSGTLVTGPQRGMRDQGYTDGIRDQKGGIWDHSPGIRDRNQQFF